MKAIKLYEQLKKLIDGKVIDENTEIIADGEYGYGIDINRIKVRTKAFLKGEETKIKPIPVVCLDIETYLFEHEDLGYSNMWIDKNDYNDFNE